MSKLEVSRNVNAPNVVDIFWNRDDETGHHKRYQSFSLNMDEVPFVIEELEKIVGKKDGILNNLISRFEQMSTKATEESKFTSNGGEYPEAAGLHGEARTYKAAAQIVRDLLKKG